MRIKADQKIFMRTNEHTKRCLEAAAALSGFNSLSSFILSTIYKEAQKIIKKAESRICIV